MYYVSSRESPHASPLRFGLVAAGVAIVVVRAIQMFGLDLNTTLSTFTSVFQ